MAFSDARETLRGVHWTRISLLVALAFTVLGTSLPWLTGAPEGVLKHGSGTIVGFDTPHGMFALGVAALFGLLALLENREKPLSRRLAAAAMPAFLLAFCGMILVAGTNVDSVLDEARAKGMGGLELDLLAVQLQDLDKGVGALISFLAWPLAGLVALVSLFVRRR